jgi:hypothetical protein
VFDYAVDVIRSRMASLGIGEQSTSDFEQQIVQLRDYWSVYAPSAWEYSFGEEKGNHEAASVPALMRKRREKMSEVHGDNSIMVMTSMRSVDGQTQLQIANPYAFLEGGN